MHDLTDLQTFIAYQSISTEKKYAREEKKTAQWLARKMAECGIKTEVMGTSGMPVVYGELGRRKNVPTVLVYGHYDVQPVEPVDEWSVPPFGGVIKDGAIWGRGTSDNKGQFWCHILAIQDHLKKGKEIPINLKFLIEGEEEIGSPSLEDYIATNRAKLQSEVVWISDGSATTKGAPTIDAGLRGGFNFEITICGPKQDLHSGSYGGAIANPLNELAIVLSKMWDKDGRVAIPGFYDDVEAISALSKEAIKNEGLVEHEFLKKTGARALKGERGFSTPERIGLRPTIQVTGIKGGYAEEGYKNIVPKEVTAKINVRLVKGQDWQKIQRITKRYLRQIISDGVGCNIAFEPGNNAYLTDPGSRIILQAQRVFSRIFEKQAVVRFEGGSLPVANWFARDVSANVLLSGWAQEMHVVDEKLSLDLLEKGVVAVQEYWEEFAKHKKT